MWIYQKEQVCLRRAGGPPAHAYVFQTFVKFSTKGVVGAFQIVFSLNSLAVRVPHNVSRRVFQFQTPNPLLVAGGWWLAVAGIGFIVKPMVFQS